MGDVLPPFVFVDDDAADRATAAAALRVFSNPLIPCVDGVELFDLLSRDVQPVLIMVDLVLPGMSGYDVIARIRTEFPALARVPTVIITSANRRRDMETGTAVGADFFIRKPLTLEKLVATLSAAGGIRLAATSDHQGAVVNGIVNGAKA